MKISELKHQIYLNQKKLEAFERYKAGKGTYMCIRKDFNKEFIEFSDWFVITEIMNKHDLIKRSKL